MGELVRQQLDLERKKLVMNRFVVFFFRLRYWLHPLPWGNRQNQSPVLSEEEIAKILVQRLGERKDRVGIVVGMVDSRPAGFFAYGHPMQVIPSGERRYSIRNRFDDKGIHFAAVG